MRTTLKQEHLPKSGGTHSDCSKLNIFKFTKILLRRLTIFSVCHKMYAIFFFPLLNWTHYNIYTHIQLSVATDQFTSTLEKHSCTLIKF